MKRNLATFVGHVTVLITLGASTVCGWRENDRLRKELSDSLNQLNRALTLREKANAISAKWQELYRDCQAARQFSEPTHAADAVNDVTR